MYSKIQYQIPNPSLMKRIIFKKPNDTSKWMNLETKNDTSINVYYENFIKEELKMLYMPYIYVKNYINIRYLKVNQAMDYYSGIILAENNEPMIWYASVFRVSVHCELQDSIIKFPFDKHTCNLEVNYYHFHSGMKST